MESHSTFHPLVATPTNATFNWNVVTRWRSSKWCWWFFDTTILLDWLEFYYSHIKAGSIDYPVWSISYLSLKRAVEQRTGLLIISKHPTTRIHVTRAVKRLVVHTLGSFLKLSKLVTTALNFIVYMATRSSIVSLGLEVSNELRVKSDCIALHSSFRLHWHCYNCKELEPHLYSSSSIYTSIRSKCLVQSIVSTNN